MSCIPRFCQSTIRVNGFSFFLFFTVKPLLSMVFQWFYRIQTIGLNEFSMVFSYWTIDAIEWMVLRLIIGLMVFNGSQQNMISNIKTPLALNEWLESNHWYPWFCDGFWSAKPLLLQWFLRWFLGWFLVRQPLVPMVLRWSWNLATIGSDSFSVVFNCS